MPKAGDSLHDDVAEHNAESIERQVVGEQMLLSPKYVPPKEDIQAVGVDT